MRAWCRGRGWRSPCGSRPGTSRFHASLGCQTRPKPFSLRRLFPMSMERPVIRFLDWKVIFRYRRKDGPCRSVDTAERLGLSVRQVRLLARYSVVAWAPNSVREAGPGSSKPSPPWNGRLRCAAPFQSRTMKRSSSSTRSGSVPLWSRIDSMIRFRTPIPWCSTPPAQADEEPDDQVRVPRVP